MGLHRELRWRLLGHSVGRSAPHDPDHRAGEYGRNCPHRRHAGRRSDLGQGYGGWQVPDIVANLRVDQAWGNAQVMGALHQVNAPYYGGAAALGRNRMAIPPTSGAGPWVRACTSMCRSLGTTSRVRSTTRKVPAITTGIYDRCLKLLVSQGASEGYGINSDCVYGGVAGTTGTNCLLTTAWSVAGGL